MFSDLPGPPKNVPARHHLHDDMSCYGKMAGTSVRHGACIVIGNVLSTNVAMTRRKTMLPCILYRVTNDYTFSWADECIIVLV